MALDTSTLLSPDQLFVGRASSQHQYYERNNLTEITDSKEWMHDAVEEMIKKHAVRTSDLRFMSLPGRFWRFESRLLHKFKNVHFTGFERDHKVILSGAGYVPRSLNPKGKSRHGFKCIESLGVEYFKTNRARWLSMDVNAALTLNDSMFKGHAMHDGDGSCHMAWFMNKFCGWDAVWLDYYGPASTQIGDALSNLHLFCRQVRTPVAVTILKGRESGFEPVIDRRRWLSSKLSGGGVWVGIKFEEIDYRECSEGGVTMCNLLGIIRRL